MQIIVSDLLIRHLTEIFPDKLPPKSASIEDIRILQGHQEVVEYIRSLKDEEDFTNVHG